MSGKEESQAFLMTILGTEVGGGVSINILGIGVSPGHQQGLNHSEVPSNAGDMEGSPEVLGPRINDGTIFDEDLHDAGVTLAGSDMQGRPSVTVSAVNSGLGGGGHGLLENLKGFHLVTYLHGIP